MPTTPRKARLLLKEGKAAVYQLTPFTIQLNYPTGEAKQEITLGVDAGSKTVGLSATTKKEELYASECTLRNDIVEKLATRRQMRRQRRNRKTRYRQARFLNRRKPSGWLAPSIRQKINTHFQLVKQVHRILPVSKIVVETAAFDIQKIKNPEITGKGYQEGDQLGFWNVREYVLFRDGHVCQHCKGKSKDLVLNVHHIESRKTGGDAPNNLITLCETCHTKHHAGKISLTVKRGASFRDATFMGIMRWAFFSELKQQYQDVGMTFGYVTKNTRIRNGLEKTHAIDARCISGNPLAKHSENRYLQRAVRTKNRQIHKMTTDEGGYRKLNQQLKYLNGFQLFDKVKTPDGTVGFVNARRKSGSYRVCGVLGNSLNAGITWKKLQKLEARKTVGTVLDLLSRRKEV